MLAIEAFNQSWHCPCLQFRDMVELRLRAPGRHQRQTSQRRDTLHSILRKLHLKLKRIAGIWIAPVVRVRKPRRGSRRHNRTDHIRHGEPELARSLPVDVDIERWVIVFLSELQIPQETQFCQLRLDLSGVSVIVGETSALHRNFHGRGRSKAHHLRNDIGGFERNLARRQFAPKAGPDSLTQRFASRSVGFHGNLDDRLLWATGKQMDQVHRVAGRNNSYEVTGDHDVVRAGLLLNNVESAKNYALGLFDSGTRWRAQANAQQRSVGIRKQLGPNARKKYIEQRERYAQVTQHQRPSKFQNHTQVSFVKSAQAAENSLVLFAAMRFTHQPGGKDRHQAAREQIGRDHRERDGQRQRHEKLAAHADHEERRNKYSKNAEHRKQARHRGAAACFQHRSRP